MKEFRPRLDEAEIRFLLFALENFSVTLEVMLRDQKRAYWEEYRAKREFAKWKDYKLLLDWRAKKSLLVEFKIWHLEDQASIVQDMKRRFKQLLNGGKPHPGPFASLFLEQLFGTK